MSDESVRELQVPFLPVTLSLSFPPCIHRTCCLWNSGCSNTLAYSNKRTGNSGGKEESSRATAEGEETERGRDDDDEGIAVVLLDRSTENKEG